MTETRYLVKDKYTYERTWQTDYSYRPDYEPYSYAQGGILSHNYILPLWKAEKGLKLCEGNLADGTSEEKMLSAEESSLFGSVSGFNVTLGGCEGEPVVRVTLFGADGESFSSVTESKFAKGEKGMNFSTLKMNFRPVRLKTEIKGGSASVSVSAVYVWDTLAQWGGQTHFYTEEKGSLYDDGASMALKCDSEGFASFSVNNLPLDRGGPYSMRMPLRNTVYCVLRNPDGIKKAKIYFTSEKSPEWNEENSYETELEKTEEQRAYYFNFSLCPGAVSRLTAFRFAIEGEGTLYIDSYSFEQEKSLVKPLAAVESCIANPENETIKITGTLLPGASEGREGGKLSVYISTMADDNFLGRLRENTAGKRKIGETELKEGKFTIDNIPLRDDKTTLLMYEFLLFAEKEGTDPECLCPRFFIENYECFDGNPYYFKLNDYTADVLDFGAYGDGIHDDTEAIQKAIDDVNANGGGTVLLPGREGIYGRRYIATSLLLRDNVEIHFGDGAVLWQSQRMYDYTYEPCFGHDGVIPGINWTHSLHVSNLPFIQGASVENIKITGKGSIRMLDTGSEEGVGMPGYAVGCYRRIHIVPIGLFNCRNIECRDIEVIRSNNYNTDFNKCRYVYLANVRLHEVKCVSGDGYGVGGSKYVTVNRCFLQSNDDGIVMTCHYFDPRGILWWTNMKGEDGSTEHIKTVHSYINSGGGKALAFITWGTNDPDQSKEEIRMIEAYDNYLTSVNPVGTWFDNPYNGKQPFDNTETDDFSPVKQVRILGNRYSGNCTLWPLQVTDILTDCGITSTNQFRNGDFTLGGLANWTVAPGMEENVDTVIFCDKEKGRIKNFGKGITWAAQGLNIDAGTHTVKAQIMTGPNGAQIFVRNIRDGKTLAVKNVICRRPAFEEITFETSDDSNDVYIGISSVEGTKDDFAVFDFWTIESKGTGEDPAVRRERKYLERIAEKFDNSEGNFTAKSSDKKVYLEAEAMNGEMKLATLKEYDDFTVECAVEVCDYNRNNGKNSFGYRFALSEDGKSYKEFRFCEYEQSIRITDVTPEGTTVLYERLSFFFTSLDFHIFKIICSGGLMSLWIDGSMYAQLSLKAVRGRVQFFINDTHGLINGLDIK